jgi:hypothetical protein
MKADSLLKKIGFAANALTQRIAGPGNPHLKLYTAGGATDKRTGRRLSCWFGS